MTLDEILQIPPYSLGRQEKQKLLDSRLNALTAHHRLHCPEYAKILDVLGCHAEDLCSYKELPYLPVGVFKNMDMMSISRDDVVKTMTSSGTTGQKVSKICLDRATASAQQKALVKIVSDFTGAQRMPMIILDCPSVLKNRSMFSARGAGILGFSIFGAKKIYAFDDDMNLDAAGISDFLEKFSGQRVMLFGFTFMIWQYFYRKLAESGTKIDLSNGILIHGGGWKKLINEAVSQQEFHERLHDVCGIERIHDYYGMVEQTGCIYMQCEHGHLHASVYSDVIMRRPSDFSECAMNERGIIQAVSVIPESYPGHSLITEDEGEILGEDDCPCGRLGKYFRVYGRIKGAEIRGCSDTYEGR